MFHTEQKFNFFDKKVRNQHKHSQKSFEQTKNFKSSYHLNYLPILIIGHLTATNIIKFWAKIPTLEILNTLCDLKYFYNVVFKFQLTVWKKFDSFLFPNKIYGAPKHCCRTLCNKSSVIRSLICFQYWFNRVFKALSLHI